MINNNVETSNVFVVIVLALSSSVWQQQYPCPIRMGKWEVSLSNDRKTASIDSIQSKK